MSADGDSWFLLNASPDLRQQIGATPSLWPRVGLRSSPIAGVVVTGGDVDAIAGLLTLRERHAFVIYAPEPVLDVLQANSIFNVCDPALVPRRALRTGEATRLLHADGRASGLVCTAFAVPGKVPLYLEDEGVPALSEDAGTIGLMLSDGDGRTMFYIPGCAAMTPALAARLRGAPMVLFDGTLWTDDEMIRTGAGSKSGQRMGHMSVSGPAGTMAAFADLGVRRKILIHINNSNPVLLADSPERAQAEAQGWEIAWDGMALDL